MKEIRKVLGGSSGELCNCGEDNTCGICKDCKENQICLAAGPGHGTATNNGKCVYNIISSSTIAVGTTSFY